MDLRSIEKRILALSSFVKDIEVSRKNGILVAKIKPNLQTLKESKIINIESEIRWYAIELYNMEVSKENKIISYEILYSNSQNDEQVEPSDDVYRLLKEYLATLSKAKIKLSSHIELDLGLDSLEYVELFIFIENSFGVEIDEKIFSQIMTMDALYSYVNERATKVKRSRQDFEEFLKEPIAEKLVYSPFIVFFYKTLMLPIFKLYFRLATKGMQNIPEMPCIIAPSHQSMLDGFLILATLPYSILKRSFFLSYKQVFGKGIFRPLAVHGQNILIDANEDLKGTMQYAALPLRKNGNLVIFPEGARTRDRELLEFRPFFAILSKTFNLPVVPVVIDGSFEALESGSLFPLPKKINVTYLEPIYPQKFSVEEITKMTKEAIVNEMELHPVLLK